MTNGDTSARQAPQSTQCFQFKGDTEIYPSKVSPGDKGQEELGEAVDRGTGTGVKCWRPRGNTTVEDFCEECVRTPHRATAKGGTQQAWPSTAELGWGPRYPFVKGRVVLTPWLLRTTP